MVETSNQVLQEQYITFCYNAPVAMVIYGLINLIDGVMVMQENR